MLSRLIVEPEAASCDIDGVERLSIHRRILDRKAMLREVFVEFHNLMMNLDERFFGSTAGSRIELGAGVFPIRESYPDVVATDIVDGPYLDRVLDAQAMDLPDASVRTLFGQNCFHHLTDPQKFLAEATRVLAIRGGIVLIEPYYGPVASLLFKRMFASEGFDKDMDGWRVPVTGPMNGANQALSYIVFERDHAKFAAANPGLAIVHHAPLTNYLRYLFSGGLNFKQLMPSFSAPLLQSLETLVAPFARVLALHHVIVIRRK